MRKPAGQPHAPYVVDIYSFRKMLSYDANSLVEAMRIAKRENGIGPAVVWKHTASGDYKAHRAVVEGKVLK